MDLTVQVRCILLLPNGVPLVLQEEASMPSFEDSSRGLDRFEAEWRDEEVHCMDSLPFHSSAANVSLVWLRFDLLNYIGWDALSRLPRGPPASLGRVMTWWRTDECPAASGVVRWCGLVCGY